jgi:hypothetical protein
MFPLPLPHCLFLFLEMYENLEGGMGHFRYIEI